MEDRFKITAVLAFCILVIGVSPAWAQWVPGGVEIRSGVGAHSTPRIVSDGANGAMVFWLYSFNNEVLWLCAQRISNDGFLMWSLPCIFMSSTVGSYEAVSDGFGGAIITWLDQGIHVQKINSDGVMQWGADGVVIYDGTDVYDMCKPVPDGGGGSFVIWKDMREDVNRIFGQRVNTDGVIQWIESGVPICATSESDRADIISDGATGAIIAWPEGSYRRMRAQKVDSNGNLVWATAGVIIAEPGGLVDAPKMASDCDGGAIITWEDCRAGGCDVYAQRISTDGNLTWRPNGVEIGVRDENMTLQIASDGSGGAIIAWERWYSDPNGIQSDVFAQHIISSGVASWMNDGVAVSSLSGRQNSPLIVADGSGGAVIAFFDDLPGVGNQALAQRFDAEGLKLWSEGGKPVFPVNSVGTFALVSDGAGDAIISAMGCGYNCVRVQSTAFPEEPPVATLLRYCSARFNNVDVVVEWCVAGDAEDLEWIVRRASSADGPFMEPQLDIITADDLSFACFDRSWEPGASYWYRIEYREAGERKVLFEAGPVTTPAMPLTLYQNHPNPFNPLTVISYYVPDRCNMTLDIYDISGKRISQLVRKEQEKGFYTAAWNGLDSRGTSVASGIYFYRLTAGKETVSKKMVLLK